MCKNIINRSKNHRETMNYFQQLLNLLRTFSFCTLPAGLPEIVLQLIGECYQVVRKRREIERRRQTRFSFTALKHFLKYNLQGYLYQPTPLITLSETVNQLLCSLILLFLSLYFISINILLVLWIISVLMLCIEHATCVSMFQSDSCI